MKKVLSIILILIVLAAITVAGVLYLRKSKDSGAEIEKAIEEMEPEIERLKMHGSGGLFYNDFIIEAYSDESGYHLYFKDSDDVEEVYELTKTEYLICTNLTHEDIDYMINSPGAKGTDLFEFEFAVKYKGKEEIEIPRKPYIYLPMPTLFYFVDLKTNPDSDIHRVWYGGDLTNRHFPAVCESIEKYFLVHKVAYSSLNYSFTGETYVSEGSGSVKTGNPDYDIPKAIDSEYSDFFYITKEGYSEDKISRLKEIGFEQITSEGSEAYYKTVQDGNCIAFFIYYPDDNEHIVLFSDVPAELEVKKFIKYVTNVL